jgi:ankyrin repeat protein
MSKYLLHNAVQRSELADVRLAISQGSNLDELDDFGNSPLHWAVIGGYEDIVLELLEAGADPNVISSDGITPKWSAADFGLTGIETPLAAYGGKITTDDKFDRISWSMFKDTIGQKLPNIED